jgi:hypothetical protein
VEARLNLGGPSSKAKYSLVTDSELVPRGKGEKNPCEGSEKTLKPCVYKQTKHYGLWQCAMSCLLHNEPASYGTRQG